MRLYRLAKAKYAHTNLDDEAIGAKRSGGRWNSMGTAIVYASYNVATTALETLVRIDWEIAPAFLLLAIDVPDDLPMDVIDPGDLPEGWEAYPAPKLLAEIGDEWCKNGNTLMLEVPSAASPYESNVLLNPAHPDAARCTVTIIGPYLFDVRLTS